MSVLLPGRPLERSQFSTRQLSARPVCYRTSVARATISRAGSAKGEARSSPPLGTLQVSDWSLSLSPSMPKLKWLLAGPRWYDFPSPNLLLLPAGSLDLPDVLGPSAAQALPPKLAWMVQDSLLSSEAASSAAPALQTSTVAGWCP